MHDNAWHAPKTVCNLGDLPECRIPRDVRNAWKHKFKFHGKFVRQSCPLDASHTTAYYRAKGFSAHLQRAHQLAADELAELVRLASEKTWDALTLD